MLLTHPPDEYIMAAQPPSHSATPAPTLPDVLIPVASRIIFHPEIPVMVDRRQRRLTVEACDGTRMVANALEYLADSREIPSGKISGLDPTQPDVYALLILMEARYQIYVSCPVVERRKGTLAGIFKGRDRRRPV